MGVPKGFETHQVYDREAEKWLLRAAEQDYAPAQCALMTFESESCKHLRDWIAKASKTGDTRSKQLIEFLLADEVNHVLYGIHWIDELTKNDPDRRKRVLGYPDEVLGGQHPVGVYFNETINARG